MGLLSSFNTGVSGLAAAGTSMGVIGDNIANAGTHGFKRSRAEFQDMLARSLKGIDGGDQIGSGSKLAHVTPKFTQGNISRTDSITDLAINGNGFFEVEAAKGRGFTRDGSFHFDKEGHMINGDGYKVIGYQGNEDGEITRLKTLALMDNIIAMGGGGIYDEARHYFPEARIMLLASDTAEDNEALKAMLASIREGEVDIIVGTQIIAKGHHFPNLTCVGVIDADLGLMGSDLRAAERTFQLMRQVAGRAGRAEIAGEAVLQTFQPEHPVIRAILGGDEEAFWAAEAGERKAAGVPPYGRMAGIVLSSPNVQEVFDLGADMARMDEPLRKIGAQVFGPAPAPIARIRGRHRVRLLVKAEKSAPLQQALTAWAGQFKLRGELRMAIDIDPQSFY